MPDIRRIFGTEVEQKVAQYLKGLGFQIIKHQFKTIFGEIDLVCRDGDDVVFVEVKARKSSSYGYPEESVNAVKLRKIARCAQEFMKHELPSTFWRIDVVAVEVSPVFNITHIKDIDTGDTF